MIGRHARLELTFGFRNGRTFLRDAYAEPPFRAGRCFPDGAGLHMIIASAAPGAFGGDCLHQIIRVERGACVRLTSQSALQVHPTPDEATAQLRSAYHVEDEATLHCHWDPLIPFAGARVDQRIAAHIAATGRLYWSDALMCGREARGERWKFASLAHELRVSRAGALEYLERYRIHPGEDDLSRPWIVDDAAYLGTILASGWDVDADAAGRLQAELAEIIGARAGADRLDHGLLLVRLMAASGPPFHRARMRVAQACGT